MGTTRGQPTAGKNAAVPLVAGCWPGKDTATLVGGCWPSTETVAVAGGCWPSKETATLEGGCGPAIETRVCIGWVLGSNQDMGVCWVGVGQQSRHGCALGGCWAAIKTWMLFQHNRDAIILVLDECSAAMHAILVLDDCSAAMHAILVLDE